MSSGNSVKMPGKKKKYNARFPPARIKKIMQKDEEVGKVAAPVPVIISRALELFVESLLTRAGAITESRHARTLTPAHLKQCILAERRFDFLQDLVSTVADINPDGESGEMSPGIFGSGLLTSPVASAVAGSPPHTPLTPGTPMGSGGNAWSGEGSPSMRGRGVVGRVRGGRGRGRGGRGRSGSGSGSDGAHYQPRPRGRPKKVPIQNRMVMDDMDSDEGLSVDIDSEEEEDEESETDDEVIEVAESHSITNHAVPSARKEIPPLAPLPHTIPPVPDLKPINTSPNISHTKSLHSTPKIPGLQISIGGNFSNLAGGIKSGVSSDSPSKNNFPFSPTSSTPSALSSSFSSPLSSGIQISFLSPNDKKVSITSNNSSPKNTITITPTSSIKSPFPSTPKVSSSIPIHSPMSSPTSVHSKLHSPGINSPSSIPPQSPVSASAKPSFGVPVPVITSVHAMRFPLHAPQRQISQTEVDEDYDT